MCAARDRALPSLFVDAPVLPASAMAILEWLVGLGQADGGEAASTEQCTLGLITLRDVVMHRQAERSACLALVLRCTVHADDVLRGKAIRMVVNQLHPLVFAALEIESFASERLESVPQLASTEEAAPDAVSDTEETLRRISLYFALCTRADTLLPRLFTVYAASGPAARPAFHRNMVRLMCIANDARLLTSLSLDAPGWSRTHAWAGGTDAFAANTVAARGFGGARSPGAPSLSLRAMQQPAEACCCIAQTFQALCDTDAGFPAQLLQAGRSAYEATKQDVRFLLPCLPGLAKDELRALLPQIVALSSEDVVGAFRRILDVRYDRCRATSAADVWLRRLELV